LKFRGAQSRTAHNTDIHRLTPGKGKGPVGFKERGAQKKKKRVKRVRVGEFESDYEKEGLRGENLNLERASGGLQAPD